MEHRSVRLGRSSLVMAALSIRSKRITFARSCLQSISLYINPRCEILGLMFYMAICTLLIVLSTPNGVTAGCGDQECRLHLAALRCALSVVRVIPQLPVP